MGWLGDLVDDVTEGVRDAVGWARDKLGLDRTTRTHDFVADGVRVRSTHTTFADGTVRGSLVVLGTVAVTTWAGVGFSGAGDADVLTRGSDCGTYLVSFADDQQVALEDPVAVPAGAVVFTRSRAEAFHLVEFDDGRTYAIPSNAIITVRDDGRRILLFRVGGNVFALPASALPASARAIPSNALPASARPALAIPSNAIPSNALPASALPASALPASARVDPDARAIPSNALPASALPASLVDVRPEFYALPFGDGLTYAIPSNSVTVEGDTAYILLQEAIPSNALPAAALPAAALPASALPASALPASVLPPQAIPSNALPASARAIPSNALAASARGVLEAAEGFSPLPAVTAASFRLGETVHALPAAMLGRALPASAREVTTALPASALPAAALPASALPAAALPAEALPASVRASLPDIAELAQMEALAAAQFEPAATVPDAAISGATTQISWAAKRMTAACPSVDGVQRLADALREQQPSWVARRAGLSFYLQPVDSDEELLAAEWGDVVGQEFGAPLDDLLAEGPAEDTGGDDVPASPPTEDPDTGQETAGPDSSPDGDDEPPDGDDSGTETADTTAPTITSVELSDDELYESGGGCSPTSVTVTVRATDAGGIRDVELDAEVAGARDSTALTGSGGTWTGTVGPYPSGTLSDSIGTIDLEVTVTDRSGNASSASAAADLLVCFDDPPGGRDFPPERTSSNADIGIAATRDDCGLPSGHGTTYDVGQSVWLCWAWDWSPHVDVYLLGWPDQPYRSDAEPTGTPTVLDFAHEETAGSAEGRVSLSPGGYHVFRVELREHHEGSCEAVRCGALLTQAQIWVWVEG